MTKTLVLAIAGVVVLLGTALVPTGVASNIVSAIGGGLIGAGLAFGMDYLIQR